MGDLTTTLDMLFPANAPHTAGIVRRMTELALKLGYIEVRKERVKTLHLTDYITHNQKPS